MLMISENLRTEATHFASGWIDKASGTALNLTADGVLTTHRVSAHGYVLHKK